jgi:hypothetical protein
VAALHTKVVIFQVDVEIRQDQLALDKLQMIRVASSPLSSTTLIFGIEDILCREHGAPAACLSGAR